MADVNRTVGLNFTVTGVRNNSGFRDLQNLLRNTKTVVDNLQKSLNTLTINNRTITGMERLRTSLSGLSNIRLPNLNSFTRGLDRLTASGNNVGRATVRIQQLATSLNHLGGIRLPNLNSFTRGLLDLSASGRDVGRASIRIRQLTTDLTALGRLRLPSTTQFTRGLVELSRAGRDVGRASVRIQQLATSIRLLGNVRLPSTRQFAAGLVELSQLRIGNLPSTIAVLASSLLSLSSVRVPSLAPFVNSLNRLKELDVNAVVARLRELDRVLRILAQSRYFDNIVRFSESLRNLNNTMRAATNASIRLQNQFRTLRSESDRSGSSIRNFSDKVRTLFEFRFISSSLQLLRMGLNEGVSSIIDFDQALANLEAITRATSDEIGMLGEKALEVAARTKFSAVEIADALVIIGQAGFSAAESAEVIDGVADLAAGTLSSIETSVSLITTTLRVFNLQASESSRVADVFSNAINRSKLNIDALSVSLGFLGPIADEAGLSLQETSAAMAILANAGQRASRIGTGLRRVWAELLNPSKNLTEQVQQLGLALVDIDPSAQENFTTVLDNLNVVIRDASDAFRLFGKRGALAAIELTRNRDKFQEFVTLMSEVGTAAELAGIQAQGLGFRIKNLSDVLRNLAIQIGGLGIADFFGVFIDLARRATVAVSEFLAIPFVGTVTKWLIIVGIVGSIVAAFSGFIAVVSAVVPILVTLAGSIGLLSAPVLIAVAAITSLVIALTELSSNRDFRLFVRDTILQGRNLSETFDMIVNRIEGFFLRIERFLDNTKTTIQRTVGEIIVVMGSLIDASLRASEALVAVGPLNRWLNQALGLTDATENLIGLGERLVQSADQQAEANRRIHDILRQRNENERQFLNQTSRARAEEARILEEINAIKEVGRNLDRELRSVEEEINSAYQEQLSLLEKREQRAGGVFLEQERRFRDSVEETEEVLERVGESISEYMDEVWGSVFDNEDFRRYQDQLRSISEEEEAFNRSRLRRAQEVQSTIGRERITIAQNTASRLNSILDSSLSDYIRFQNIQVQSTEEGSRERERVERESSERITRFSNDILESKRESYQRVVEVARTELNRLLQEETTIRNRIRSLQDDILSSEMRGEEALRELRRANFNEEELLVDRRLEFNQLLRQARSLEYEDTERAIEVSRRAQEVARQLTRETVDGRIDTAEASRGVAQAYALEQSLLRTQIAQQRELERANERRTEEVRAQYDQIIGDFDRISTQIQEGLIAELRIDDANFQRQLGELTEQGERVIQSRINLNVADANLRALRERIETEISQRQYQVRLDFTETFDDLDVSPEALESLREELQEVVNQTGGLGGVVKALNDILGLELQVNQRSLEGVGPEAEQSVRNFSSSLDEVPTKLGQISTASQSVTAGTSEAFNSVQRNVSDLGNSLFNTTEETNSFFDNLRRKAEEAATFLTFSVDIIGIDAAISAIDRLIARISDIRDRTVTVTTRFVNVGSAPSGFRTGGRIGSGYGGGDRRPVLAEDGEWFIRKEAVRKYGDGFMSALNSMRLPKFQEGGRVAFPSVSRGLTQDRTSLNLDEFGRVDLSTGTQEFPAIVHRNAFDQVERELRKRKRLRS